jgi:hypothetical protein
MTRGSSGYWNGMTWQEPQTASKYLGWNARAPPGALVNGMVSEFIAPSARDPPGESGIQTTNAHAFEFKADTIYGLNHIGKTLMVWNNNSEPGTGRMNEPTMGDWDATTHDWKQDNYLAMNEEGFKLEKAPVSPIFSALTDDLQHEIYSAAIRFKNNWLDDRKKNSLFIGGHR